VDVTGGVPSCPSCGETIPDPSSNTGHTPAARFAIAPVVYAGFWLRAVAFLIDYVLFGTLVSFVILLPMMERAGISFDDPRLLQFTGQSRQILAVNLATIMAGWLYWALMESSPWQATLGKRIVGLRVTDLAGGRISFARASGRHFGKAISSLTLLFGFVMAGLTEKKQALHDIIAGCLVVKRT
jgi:uncharacterized RDD family membrane protein YckC